MRPWVVLALGLLATGGCSRPDARAQTGALASAAVDTPAARVQPVYIDVRTPAEYAAGHVAGAVNIPYDQMEQRWTELAALRDKPVVLYCHSGRRAGIALQVLLQHDFRAATNGGGIEGLARLGVPMVAGPVGAPAAAGAPVR